MAPLEYGGVHIILWPWPAGGARKDGDQKAIAAAAVRKILSSAKAVAYSNAAQGNPS
jgi:hypothetical protein